VQRSFSNNFAESKPIWNNVSEMWGWPWQILGAIRAVATVGEGSFFQKKQKSLTKFPRFVTSGRHNSAVITNAENSRPNWMRSGTV